MKLINICKKYKDKIILNNISLDFSYCGMVFILGRSGSGKSTLLHIMGLLDNEFKGKIIIGDYEIVDGKSIKNEIIRNNIDFVFQKFNLIKHLTVSENIKLAREVRNQVIDESEVEILCDKLKIYECKNRIINDVSGGEEQRSAVARTIYRSNDIILADEPTGSVDEENEKVIFEELKKLSKEKLVIVVSHNKEAAHKYADRIITISDGQIASDIDYGYKNNKKKAYKKDKNVIQNSKCNEKIHWRLNLAVNNLLSRKRKVIPSILCMIVTMLCLGGLMSIIRNVNDISSGISNNIMENDRYIVKKEDDEGYREIIKDDFIDVLKEVEGIDFRSFEYMDDDVCLMEGEYGKEIDIVFFEDNDFFRDRYEIISGNYPQQDDEVLISRCLSERLFNNIDVTGRKITLSTNGGLFEVKISGVKEDGVLKKEEIYALGSFGKEIYSNNVFNSGLFWYKKDNKFDTFYFENKNLDKEKNNGEFNIVYGEMPKKNNEVLIGVDAVNKILNLYEKKITYSTKDLLEKKLVNSDQDLIFNTKLKYLINDSDVYNIEIVGICANSSMEEEYYDSDEGTCFLKSTYLRGIKNYYPINDVSLYISNSSIVKKVKDKCNTYGYELESSNYMINKNIGDRFRILSSFLSVAIIALFLLTIFIVGYSAKNNALDCYYEIGVLKSLGCSKANIFFRFMYEYILIGMFSGSIAGIIGIIISNIRIIKIDGVALLSRDIFIWIKILAISIIVCVLSSLMENVKASRKSVLKCIKY